MISVSEARQLVVDHTQPLHPVQLPLKAARGLVLATPVLAPIDLPVFNNSAMDGYAVSGLDAGSWNVVGEVQAGADASAVELKPGEAVRIFTGAPTPQSAEAVIMQEHVQREGDSIQLTHDAPKPGQHIRKQGEELRTGEVGLHNGSLLTPAALGFLAMLGQHTANVRPRPRVHLVTTGNELVEPGQPLGPGQIYESNSVALGAAAERAGAQPLKKFTATDDLEATRDALRAALAEADVLLVSGGISVGDYDFVEDALAAVGVGKVFHKVRQRPGKPLFFGKQGQKLVFGLPGNPASARVGCYESVYPALRKLMGHQKLRLHTVQLPLLHPYKKKPGRAWFVRAFMSAEGVKSLEGQGSHMMGSFAHANALMFLPAEVGELEAGAMVEVHLLPRD